MLVSIIVLNWNGLPPLGRCPSALCERVAEVTGDTEIIVVDNGSVDGSCGFIERQFPRVRLLRNSGNRGYVAASNQALRLARGRYIATLNNDTEAERRWLVEAIGVLEGDEKVGICAAQLRFLHDRDRINSAGLVMLDRSLVVDRLRNEPISCSEDHPVEVFGACGAAAVFRATLLKELGGFYEPFFAYYEDVDLAWRAKRAGWKAVYVPNAIVYHVGSATSARIPLKTEYLASRNRIWMLARNLRMRQFLGVLGRLQYYDVRHCLHAGPRPTTVAFILGRLAALGGLRPVWHVRPDLAYLTNQEMAPPPNPLVAFRQDLRLLRRLLP